MSELESLEKLRKQLRDTFAKESVSILEDGNALMRCADAIEAEAAERYMLLPVDADGVPIHVGDKLKWCGEYIDVNGVCKDTVWFEPSGDQEWKCIWSNTTRHYKPRTVEDVLLDFLKESRDFNLKHTGEVDEAIKRYSAELQMRGDAE